jgi:hypothetical protein
MLQLLRNSTKEEYIRTYLERDFHKSLSDDEWCKRQMGNHLGKMDKGILWDGKWSLQKIGDKNDVGNVVCLDGGWTKVLKKNTGLNWRTLSSYVKQAKEIGYFDQSEESLGKEEYRKRMSYYLDYKQGNRLDFRNRNRIVFRKVTLGEKEQNPSASYYLQDGLGRMLPLFYLMEYEGLPMPEIEVLVVEPQLEYFSE